MKLIDDAIDKNYLLAQLHVMMEQKRTLLSMGAKENAHISIAYDAGYLAALTELEQILIWPPKEDKDKQKEHDHEDLLEEDIDE